MLSSREFKSDSRVSFMAMQLVYEHTARATPPSKEPVNLITVFRDEALILPHFVDYYQSLGVDTFFMIDNLSEDQGSAYLKSRRDINLKLFYAPDSFNAARLGKKWVTECLNHYCKERFCIVVDADELLLPNPAFESLKQMISHMKASGTNSVPAVLLDIYPEQLNNDYSAGDPFSEHSYFFDDLNGDYYRARSRIYKHFFWLEGGLRARCLDTYNIIHKFPVFRNDVYDHEIEFGAHFFYQGSTALMDTPLIRLEPLHAILLHYKYLKPNYVEYLQQEVANNQRWNNSSEYKNYLAVLQETGEFRFLDERLSKRYQVPDDLQKFWNLRTLINSG